MMKRAFLALALWCAATAAPAKVLCLTGNGSFTLPSDWNTSANTVEVIGPGGAGGIGTNTQHYGGGGGAYAKKNNLQSAPGASVAYQTAYGADGCFVDCTTVKAARGGDWISPVGGSGPGGTAASSIGDTKFSGGNGSIDGSGGAAGPNGAGNSASANTGGSGDAGFGGASSAGAGNAGAEYTCAAGGNVTGAAGSGGGGGGGNLGGLYGAGSSFNQNGRAGLVVITYTPRRAAQGAGVF